MGTIEYHVAGKVLPAPHTTPEPLELQRMFRDALVRGATEAVMEVSSHALAQQRVYGIPFDVAVFTNLTRDHLDYHTRWTSILRPNGFCSQAAGRKRREWRCSMRMMSRAQLVKFSKGRSAEVITYGLAKADFHATKLEISFARDAFRPDHAG